MDPPESTNAGFAAPLTGSCREADPYPTSTGARRDPGELGPPPRLSGRPVHISRRPGTKPHHHEAATGLASRFCSTPRGGHIRPHTPIDTAGVETTARRRDFAHVRSSRCKRGPLGRMLVLFRFKHHPPPPTPAHPTEVVRALSPPPTPCQVSCWPQRGPPHPRGVAVAWPVTGIREIRRYLAVVGPLAFELCVLG